MLIMKKKSLFEKQKFTFKRKCYKKDCLNPGIYKAPKSKNEIKNYIWFCEEHIKSYNKEWDYCKDMTQKEIEKHIQLDTIGWRPTWDFSTASRKFKDFEKIIFSPLEPLSHPDLIIRRFVLRSSYATDIDPLKVKS